MNFITKIIAFSTVSKLIIILIFVVSFPVLIAHLAISNTDKQLRDKKERVLKIIRKEGIENFIQKEEEYTYGSYNLLKEEFISLELLEEDVDYNFIENSQRVVEGDVVDYRVLTYSFIEKEDVYLLEIGRSIGTIGEIEKIFQKYGLYLLIIMVLITTLIEISYTRFLLSPFNKIIQNKLKKINHPSNFNYEIVKTTTKDFTLLDSSIREMMHSLELSFLREKEFISNASHELMTPISILENKFENLLNDPSLSEETSIKIVDSLKTLHRFKNIIRTLMLISKIENKQYLKEDKVSVSHVLKEVYEEAIDRCEVRNITLSLNLEGDATIEKGNYSLLFTMFLNIVNNAIKYNKERGIIYIKTITEGSTYKVTIQDTGIGITPENIPYLFQRFKRFNKDKAEGTGLGLSIVKTIADFHNMDIRVSSPPNQGTIFEISVKLDYQIQAA